MTNEILLMAASLLIPCVCHAQSPRELPLPEVSAAMTDPSERADYIMGHFWDGMDFNDKTLTSDTAFVEQNFVNYLSLIPHVREDRAAANVASLLDKASASNDLYTLLYTLAGKYLNNADSPMRDEGAYIMFLSHAAEKGPLGEADKARAQFRLEMALKNRPGTPAPDFKFVDSDGRVTSLRESLAGQKTILLFYDPDCDHCSDVIDSLAVATLPSGCRVVAIDAEEDKEQWMATNMRLPDAWTVGFALDPIQEEEWYVFPEMPTIYLLDGKGTILLKEALLETVVNNLQ